MATGSENGGPEQRGYRSPDYREITPDYVFGGFKPESIDMTLVTTKLNAFEKTVNQVDVVEHTEEVNIKLTPMQAKSVAIWLLHNIKLYESQFNTKIPGIESDPKKIEIGNKVEDLLGSL